LTLVGVFVRVVCFCFLCLHFFVGFSVLFIASIYYRCWCVVMIACLPIENGTAVGVDCVLGVKKAANLLSS